MKRYNYLAYGSNMDAERMIARCPTARLIGVGVLWGYRVVERLYADIEPAAGHVVEGVLWSVTMADLEILDSFEGVASRIYRRKAYAISLGARKDMAYSYEMWPKTRRSRDGKQFPRWYLSICRRGASQHGVGGYFGNSNRGA